MINIFSIICLAMSAYCVVYIAAMLCSKKPVNLVSFIEAAVYICAALIFGGKITSGNLVIAVILFVYAVISLLNFIAEKNNVSVAAGEAAAIIVDISMGVMLIVLK